MLICHYIKISVFQDPLIFDHAFKAIPWSEKKQRILRFHRPEDRCRSLGGAYLMNRFLPEIIQQKPDGGKLISPEASQSGQGHSGGILRLEYGSHGKPYLPDHPGIYFNLSHSGNYAALVAGCVPCGIDIEKKHRPDKYEGIVRHFFTPDERNYISDSSPDGSGELQDLAFLRIWTRKESFLKLTGDGLSEDIRELSVYPAPPEGYYFSEYQLDGHLITVCAPAGVPVTFRGEYVEYECNTYECSAYEYNTY